jgi:adenosine deaminase
VVRLGVERVGHGLRAFEDPTLVTELRDRRIPLELCPVSNVCTGVWPTLRDHPVRRYFDAGLMVTVNSDDPTMFSTSITREYEVLAVELGFSPSELRQVSLAGVEASFLCDSDKAELRRRFEMDWAELAER